MRQNDTRLRSQHTNIIGYLGFPERKTKEPFSQAEKRGCSVMGNVMGSDLSLLLPQLLHDVRSDFVNLAVMAKLLQRGHFGLLPVSAITQLAAMEKKANAAVDLAEGYCRQAVSAEGSNLPMDERIDIHPHLILPVIQEIATDLESKQISITSAQASIVRKKNFVTGSRILLQCVMRTVFQNAVRHCVRKGKIRYGIKHRGSNYLDIFVANDGAVVPKQWRKEIFDKFFSSPPATRSESNGLGLGLFLARSIISKHGGEIWYEPERRGSRFVISLPASS